MADAVTTTVLSNNHIMYDVNLTNISDGTGESAVTKVDITTLTTINGVQPETLALEKCSATIAGFTSVTLFWKHMSGNTKMVVLPTGLNTLHFCPTYLKDPAPTTDVDANTGKILLTTAGATSGAAYDIHLRFKLISK